MDLARFYAAVRSNPFPGQIRQRQVDGLEVLVRAFEKAGWPVAWAAYGLATVFRETNATMQPIHEFGGEAYLAKYDTGQLAKALGNTPEADGDGILYAGRGYVQITGKTNYAKAAKALGQPLLEKPELALQPDIAAAIMIRGMSEGWFTGKKLADYLNSPIPDYRNARRIINGTDKADLIAGYARVFAAALVNADYGRTEAPAPQPVPVEQLPTNPAGTPPPSPPLPPPPATITSDEPIPKGFWARFVASFRKRTSA